MPPTKIGLTPSVVVIQSSKLQEDRETLEAIFPGRFCVEKPEIPGGSNGANANASASFLIEENLTLILASCPLAVTSSAAPASVIVLEEETIRQAAELAVLNGLPTEEQILSQTTVVKLKLPGGASLLATTADVWSNKEARSTAISSLMAPPAAAIIEQEPVTKRSFKRIFPSLQVKVLKFNGQLGPFPLNTQVPMPVETEWFVGKLLLIMRPENPEKDDPYWNDRIFSKKKRRVVMQLQGKLKYKPQGVLYAGMEISDPMRLGLIAGGLCNLMLKMSSKFNPHIHSSFGDDKERPHICFPASTFFERLVVTKPGDELPPMGEEFVEDPFVMQDRKSYKTKIDWNTEDTYSMSFHTMYIDFPTWSVVRLPIRKDVGLQTFWRDSSASVVFYEVDSSSSESTDEKQDRREHHLTETNRYILSVEMKRTAKKDTDEASSSEDPSTSAGDSSVE